MPGFTSREPRPERAVSRARSREAGNRLLRDSEMGCSPKARGPRGAVRVDDSISLESLLPCSLRTKETAQVSLVGNAPPLGPTVFSVFFASFRVTVVSGHRFPTSALHFQGGSCIT